MAKSELSPSQQDPNVNCQRCEREMSREKASIVTTRKRTMYFCENCFRAVFKYDESLKTLPMIYEEGGRKTPFVVRSTNWHRSSYMVVKEVTETAAGSNKGGKQVFIGDMYLRGVLKEQNRPLGKANFFNWVSWSEELAQKYKEDVPSASNPPVPQEVSATTSDLAPGSES